MDLEQKNPVKLVKYFQIFSLLCTQICKEEMESEVLPFFHAQNSKFKVFL